MGDERLPKEQLHLIEREGEISGFLSQSNISKQNQKRLAALVLEVAKIRPHRRKRLHYLARSGRRDPVEALDRAGLLLPGRGW